MFKKLRFRVPFNKQHGKQAQILLKSKRQQFYHIYWSLWRQLSKKKPFLAICQILRVFVNSLTADDNYSLLNRDNLRQPIQMQLYQKQTLFLKLFPPFLKSRVNLKHFQKMITIIADVVPKLWTPKNVAMSLKTHISQDLSTSNMVNGSKHCLNLNNSTFTIFTDHRKDNWVGKSYSSSYAQS